MKKLIALLLVMCFAVCAAESVYDAMLMDSTLASVTAVYGASETEDGYLIAGDAILSFFESGRLQAKGRYCSAVSEIAALTQGSFAEVKKLKQGALLSKLTDILGEGTEIMYINIADEDNAGTRRVLAWKNAEGTVLEALFEKDDGEWVLFAVADIITNS